jgi:hypothetical protein
VTADRLLRLYPRAWRERYGEEFLATIGDGALRLQQIIDIVAGAIDAWVARDVRRAARARSGAAAPEGDNMNATLKTICRDGNLRYTKRDALIGAGVMLAVSLGGAIVGVLLSRQGFSTAGEAVTSNAFFAALVLSMPFWLLKGQPWRAQAVLVVGTLTFLAAITCLAFLI